MTKDLIINAAKEFSLHINVIIQLGKPVINYVIAKHFKNYNLHRKNELEQIGTIGFMRAVEIFDIKLLNNPSLKSIDHKVGIFLNFAKQRILGYILDSYRLEKNAVGCNSLTLRKAELLSEIIKDRNLTTEEIKNIAKEHNLEVSAELVTKPMKVHSFSDIKVSNDHDDDRTYEPISSEIDPSEAMIQKETSGEQKKIYSSST